MAFPAISLSLEHVVVGVLVGVIVEFLVIVSFRELEGRKIKSDAFLGEWLSTWQTNSVESQHSWSIERVEIKRRFNKLKLATIPHTNNNNYYWEAEASAVHENFLVGSWRSLRNPRSKGAMILSLSNQGDYLLGFFVGPNHDFLINYGAWVLARSEDGLAKAKSQLKRMGPSLGPIFS